MAEVKHQEWVKFTKWPPGGTIFTKSKAKSTSFEAVLTRTIIVHPWFFTQDESTLRGLQTSPRFPLPSGCLLIILASKLVFIDSGYPPIAPKKPQDSLPVIRVLVWAIDLQTPPSPSLVVYPGSEDSVWATDLQIHSSPSLVICSGSEDSVWATDLQIPPSPSLVLYPGSEDSVWATDL